MLTEVLGCADFRLRRYHRLETWGVRECRGFLFGFRVPWLYRISGFWGASRMWFIDFVLGCLRSLVGFRYFDLEWWGLTWWLERIVDFRLLGMHRLELGDTLGDVSWYRHLRP